MNRDKLVDLGEYEHSFNTSEAYSMNVFLWENALLIPYVNVQISDNNPFGISIGDKIDFSYLLISGVSKISWNGVYNGNNIIGGLAIDNQNSDRLTDYFGINRQNDSYEIKVNFERIEVLIPSSSKFSKNEWIPWKTPNFPQNINSDELHDFFGALELPNLLNVRFNRKESIEIEFKNKPKTENMEE